MSRPSFSLLAALVVTASFFVSDAVHGQVAPGPYYPAYPSYYAPGYVPWYLRYPVPAGYAPVPNFNNSQPVYRSYYPPAVNPLPSAPASGSPASIAPTTTATVAVRVPADAMVWLEGKETSQTGMDRLFVSPALAPGQDYVYDVHARWTENGREFDQTKSVRVRAGSKVKVDFLEATREVVPPPRPAPN